jgi:hypothetical protein
LETASSADRSADRRGSNLPLILIFVVVGIILLGTFAYAYMMTIPGSMPGMTH